MNGVQSVEEFREWEAMAPDRHRHRPQLIFALTTECSAASLAVFRELGFDAAMNKATSIAVIASCVKHVMARRTTGLWKEPRLSPGSPLRIAGGGVSVLIADDSRSVVLALERQLKRVLLGGAMLDAKQQQSPSHAGQGCPGGDAEPNSTHQTGQGETPQGVSVEVCSARNANEALALMQTRHFTAVFLDINMPGGDSGMHAILGVRAPLHATPAPLSLP